MVAEDMIGVAMYELVGLPRYCPTTQHDTGCLRVHEADILRR